MIWLKITNTSNDLTTGTSSFPVFTIKCGLTITVSPTSFDSTASLTRRKLGSNRR